MALILSGRDAAISFKNRIKAKVQKRLEEGKNAPHLAAILVGGDQIQMTMGLPGSVGHVLQGAMLFFVLGGDFFQRYRLTVQR